jgi:DNA-binding LacI/PurR family transcriptional regulator
VFVAQPKQEAAQIIALVLPTLDMEQMSKVIHGVKQGFVGTKIQVLVQSAQLDYSHEMEMIESLDVSNISGVIILPPPFNCSAASIRQLQASGKPVVLVNSPIDGLDIDTVTMDRVEIGIQVFERLIHAGHQHIGLVNHNSDTLWHRQLFEGIDRAYARMGMNLADLHTIEIDAMDLNPSQPWANGQKAATQLLAVHPQITALVGVNENISLGCWRAAKASGRKLPEELSVCSVGDLSLFANIEPALTAADIPHLQMGRVAAELLLNLLRGNDAGYHQVIRLGTRLIERQSIHTLEIPAGQSLCT